MTPTEPPDAHQESLKPPLINRSVPSQEQQTCSEGSRDESQHHHCHVDHRSGLCAWWASRKRRGPLSQEARAPPPGPVFMLSTSTYRTVSFTSPTQSLGGPEVCPTFSEATWSGIKRLWGLWLQPGCTRKLTSPSQPPSTPRKAEPRGTARAPHGVTLSKSSAWWSLSFLICEVGIIRHHPTVRQKDRTGASHLSPSRAYGEHGNICRAR